MSASCARAAGPLDVTAPGAPGPWTFPLDVLARVLPVLLAWLCAPLAEASTVEARTVADRAAASDRVVRARVERTETRLGPGGDVARMTTWSRLRVLESWKGGGPDELELLQLGGRHGPWAARLPDDAELAEGEVAVFFLRCRDARFPGRCTLAGLKDARMRAEGARLLAEPLGGAPAWRPSAEVRAEVQRGGAARPAEAPR